MEYILNYNDDTICSEINDNNYITLTENQTYKNTYTTYTPAHKRAQQKYRDKNREEYNERQRKIYEKLSQDEEWKKKFNERSKVNNQKYREKLIEQKLNDPDYKTKKIGRPKKETQKKEIIYKTHVSYLGTSTIYLT